MAGTIDELNFKVILDDKEFDAKVKNDIKLAKDLNASLSTLLDLKKQTGRFTQDDVNNNRKAQQILKDNVRAQEAITREKIKTEGVQKKINAQIERATKGYQTQSRFLNELKGYALGYLSIHGATQLLSSLVRVTGEFELQKTTLAAMLGDLNEAEKIVTRIQGLAVESPFQFRELTTYAKQLSAFSVPAQELYDTTKMLADISAGLGVGMDRIVLAYGQVRSAAFLRGQEVRQFTEAGIPILDELAKQFEALEGRAVSAGEVFDKISARLVPFEMVAKVFKDMTSEGGKFYNMQEVQAETLRGKLSNLQDAYEVMMNEIGKSQSENIKSAVDWVRELMQNYEETGRTLLELVGAYGVYKVALLAAEIATKTFKAENHKLIGSLLTIGRALSSNPYVLLASGIAAVGFAAYKSFVQLEPFEKVRKNIMESEEKYKNALASEEVQLDRLYAKLRMATKGTEDYEDAKKEIYTKYASYISSLKEEGVEVSNLIGIYDQLKNKINEAVQAKFRNMAVNDLDLEFDSQLESLKKEVDRTIRSIKRSMGRELTIGEEVGLRKYILGGDEEILTKPEMQGISNFLKGIKGFNVVEYTRNQVGSVIDEYEKAKEKIQEIWGEEVITSGGATPFVYPDEEGGKTKSPAERVQEEIDAVKKLRDAYETLSPYMSGDMLRKTLTALFPNADQDLIRSLDFRTKLVELATEMNKFDEGASKKLIESLGGEKAGEIVSAFKAVESYKEMLDSWLGEDSTLSGEGVSFDISKIIRDLNNQYEKINQKARKASDLLAKAQMGDEASLAIVRETYGEDVWQKYLVNGQRVIDELARKEREEARKTSEERVKDTANSYIKEKLFEKNIDLSDFADKTTTQIRNMVERMKDLIMEIKLEMATLLIGGVSDDDLLKIEGLVRALEVLDVKIADTGEELEKKVADQVTEIAESLADTLSKIGDEMENLGESIDNSVLERLGRQLKEYADFADDIVSHIKTLAEETKGIDFENTSFEELSEGAKGGILGLIASVATLAYNKVKDVIVQSYEYQQKLNESAEEYRQVLLQIRRDAYSGIFGSDDMGLSIENAKIFEEAQKQYEAALDKFENQNAIRNNKRFQNLLSYGSVSDVLGDIAGVDGWELYKESGEINMDALKAYYDSYADYLTKKQKEMVDELIAGYDAQNAAAEASAEYMKEVFGDVADTIASDMVDAFLESGDAANGLGDVVTDISKQLVSDLIKSVYLMPILNDYAEQIANIDRDTSLSATESTRQKLGVLDDALAEISGQSDAINATISEFAKYLGGGESEGTDALGEGIRGITEDQANLLASYLNAIRADVAYSKSLWMKMDANLQRIADMFVSSPSLMEYQAQIAANTFNTAQATQSILSELRSVITSDGGDTAVRIYQ